MSAAPDSLPPLGSVIAEIKTEIVNEALDLVDEYTLVVRDAVARRDAHRMILYATLAETALIGARCFVSRWEPLPKEPEE